MTFSCEHCRKHVVFGKVVEGMEVIRKVEQVGTADGKRSGVVKIIDCGETSQSKIRDVVGTEKGNTEIWRQMILSMAALTINTQLCFRFYCSESFLSFSTRKKEKISQTCIFRWQF